jgi:hypothetical protein
MIIGDDEYIDRCPELIPPPPVANNFSTYAYVTDKHD